MSSVYTRHTAALPRIYASYITDKCVVSVSLMKALPGDYRTDGLALTWFDLQEIIPPTWFDLYDSLFVALLRQVAADGRFSVLISSGALQKDGLLRTLSTLRRWRQRLQSRRVASCWCRPNRRGRHTLRR